MSHYVSSVNRLVQVSAGQATASPADALAKLASYDKAWITYLFLLR